ncbi:hypothetical protein EG329_005361 [Mollisiaceae sp. DMI_Dod_QoI]|nr:hypothetical protein EG329_005361 [Helotiales sp. DMI_Dod_QoI]
MIHIFGSKEPATESFTFTFLAASSLKLSFDWPKLSAPVPLNRPFKRRRALSDVDGEGKEGRKKRRLRLHLVTSRLSRPFSEPASNIANRGLSKIPVWGAKNKALGKNVLRKAAIMNRVRRRMDAAKDFMRQEQERSRERLSLREIILQKPRCLDFPLPPSPLGLSNYDALDLDDDIYNEHNDDDEAVDKVSAIYSDFNIMNPTTNNDGDDYDYLDALDGISPEDLPDTPPAPPEESIAEMLSREDSRGESIFVRVRE